MHLQPSPPTPAVPFVDTTHAAALPSPSLPPADRARRNAIAGSSSETSSRSSSAGPSTPRLPPPLSHCAGPSHDPISPNALSPPVAIRDMHIDKRKVKVKQKLVQGLLTESVRKRCTEMGIEACHHRSGNCDRPQQEHSLYCKYHTCTAFLADGDPCHNEVYAPQLVRVCAAGWHRENKRSSLLDDLLIRRRQWDIQELMDIQTQRQESALLFETLLPDLSQSSSNSSVSSSSRSTSDGAQTPPEAVLRTPTTSLGEWERRDEGREGREGKWVEMEVSHEWIRNWGMGERRSA